MLRNLGVAPWLLVIAKDFRYPQLRLDPELAAQASRLANPLRHSDCTVRAFWVATYSDSILRSSSSFCSTARRTRSMGMEGSFAGSYANVGNDSQGSWRWRACRRRWRACRRRWRACRRRWHCLISQQGCMPNGREKPCSLVDNLVCKACSQLLGNAPNLL